MDTPSPPLSKPASTTPSRPLSTTSHAVLGLLSIKPWTSYELAKQVQRSLGWFWPRAERKLYEEPKRLVAAGFATATQQHTGRRPKTVYAITARGRRELRRWLGEPSDPPALEFEAMVRVFFAEAGSLEQLRATLAQVEATALDRLAELRRMIEASKAGPYEFESRLATNALALRFQLDHQRQLADWAAWARAETEGWRSPTDAAGWDPWAVLEPDRLSR